MSTSVPPRDGGARTDSPISLTPGTILPDEQSLKREFDAHYDESLKAATGRLGEAASLAPKVVEGAFVSIWNQRGSIANSTQLSSLLAEEVMHGAARALSRRASGHRFGALGAAGQSGAQASAATQVSSAQVWAQIQNSITGATRSAATHAALHAPGVAGHEAASHMKAVGKRPSWVIPVAIGVVALVGSIAAVRYFDRLGEDDAILATVDSPTIQPLASSEAGQIGSLTLDDGTKVRIGPQTKLFVPDGFPKQIRALRVEGTASFEVAPGKPLPFRAVAKRTQIVATGTQFVVSAYPSDSGISVQVREGSVTVKAGGKATPLSANQSLHVDKGTTSQPSDDDRVAAFGWVDGRVGLQHKQLRQVVDALTRWFNSEVKVPDLPLLDRDASFDVPLDSSRLAIEQVEKSAKVKFGYEGDSKVFRDAPKKK